MLNIWACPEAGRYRSSAEVSRARRIRSIVAAFLRKQQRFPIAAPSRGASRWVRGGAQQPLEQPCAAGRGSGRRSPLLLALAEATSALGCSRHPIRTNGRRAGREGSRLGPRIEVRLRGGAFPCGIPLILPNWTAKRKTAARGERSGNHNRRE